VAVELTAVAIGAAFLVAAVVVLVYARRFAERGYEKQERYRSQLFDAELGALTRLQEASRIREDLVASVSHEFRTPLTAIRGSAATLAARGDRIPPETRETLLRGIVEHADRLNNLLEDMLLAASARPAPESGAVADVTAALSSFRLGQARRRSCWRSHPAWPRTSMRSASIRWCGRWPTTSGSRLAATGR